MISIVIPLYNKAKQIENTLRSVFSQTFQDYEIVIVNDGSTDDSVEIVAKIADNRIRIITQKNQGVSAARNRGIQESKSNLIAFLDADDEWKPEYLQTQYELFRKYPECSVFACSYELKDSAGNIKKTILNKIVFQGKADILSNYFEVAACSHPPLWTSAVIVKKSAVLSVGGFPEGIKSGEDLLTWAKLAVKYKIAFHRDSLAFFYYPENLKYREPRLNIYEDVVHLELLKLWNENGKRNDIEKYIARWNEMRVSVFIQNGNRIKAFIPLFRSVRYGGFNMKTLYLTVLIMSPVCIQNYIEKIKDGIKK
jgi:glycosyltransferase involved in cell wall biosynthesis